MLTLPKKHKRNKIEGTVDIVIPLPPALDIHIRPFYRRTSPVHRNTAVFVTSYPPFTLRSHRFLYSASRSSSKHIPLKCNWVIIRIPSSICLSNSLGDLKTPPPPHTRTHVSQAQVSLRRAGVSRCHSCLVSTLWR